jgi:ATP-dependent DNA helicase RecQ
VYKASEGKIAVDALEQIAASIAAEDQPLDIEEIAAHANLPARKAITALQHLEDAGALETTASGQVKPVEDVDPSAAAQKAAERLEFRRLMKRERLEQMRDYADSSYCRREILLQYFGDSFTGPCNFCDNCGRQEGILTAEPAVGTRREVV